MEENSVCDSSLQLELIVPRFRQLFEKTTRLVTATSIFGEQGAEPYLKSHGTLHRAPKCGKIHDCDWLTAERRETDPLLSKSHHPFYSGGSWILDVENVLLSVRNPLANWNSFMRFYNKERNLARDPAAARKSFLTYVKVWAGHHAYWRRRSQLHCVRFTAFKYEDMLEDTAAVLSGVLQELPLPDDVAGEAYAMVGTAVEAYSAKISNTYDDLILKRSEPDFKEGNPQFDGVCRDHALVRAASQLPPSAIQVLIDPADSDGTWTTVQEMLMTYGYDKVLHAALRGDVACLRFAQEIEHQEL